MRSINQIDQPIERLLRLDAILGPKGPIPVSRSSWYAGIRAGRFPSPLHLSARVSVWRASDIAALISDLATSGGNDE
jgi:predicted DNA-binding transcriptional regulator AlpA